MSVRLSIAAACYNLNEEYLRAHIERILPQLTDVTELILIDDCSKNNTGEICREYAAADDHVRYIRMDQNSGLSSVRNRSIEEAQGEWIFFADGDDLLSAHFVETALRFSDCEAEIIIHERLKFITAVPEDAPCGADRLCVLPADAGRTLSISCMCLDPNIVEGLGLAKTAFYHAAWGALYRKSFLTEHHLLFPVGQKKAQDAVFNTEVYYHAKRIAYLPYVMYFYRGNPDGITRRYSADLPVYIKSLLTLLREQQQRFFPDDADVDARMNNHRIMACIVDNMRLNLFHKDNPKSKKQRREEFLSFIEEEPYKSAIRAFDAKTYRRQEWLFTVRQIRAKRFFILDAIVSNDRRFNIFSGVYKRLAKFFG